MRPLILDIPIKRKWFGQIVEGQKRTEYRKFGKFWCARLEGKRYDQIRFRNGYMADAPTVYVEYGGLRRNKKTSEYDIRIGRILKTKHLRRKS